ncbi:MAG: hypothetical protein SF182_27080 [Deltaproteobacteria bacterium]|nr:hypothetical protein [Deltaproteobacteria bacterium]
MTKLVAGWLAAAVLLTCVGCAYDRRSSLAAARGSVRRVTEEDLAHSPLTVSVGDVSTDGRTAHVRGTIVNESHLPVSGVRYVVTIMTVGNQRVLDTFRREVDTTLDPGESKRVALDVVSTYWSAGPTRFTVVASPVELGGEAVAPPADWK